MRLAVTGTKGQVVTSLLEKGPSAGVEILAIGRPELDLGNPAGIAHALADSRPDAIVSAAAYTAVDRAESEPDAAHIVNAVGTGAVAEAAARLGIPVVHLSTDYVFDGVNPLPYAETDPTGPVSAYGRSKLEGERLVAAATPNHAILRTAWVYSPFGANFLKTMLRLAESRDILRVVADQHGQPTNALDIADAAIAIARRLVTDADPTLRGVFHMTAGGEATWADFAEAIFAGLARRGGKSVAVERITTADYPTPARRPANSRLDCSKLRRAHGITLPEWRTSMEAVLDRLIGTDKGKTA